MMKSGHAYSGLTVGLGIALVAHIPPIPGIVGAALCGGAALIPDIDHPTATISRTFGPISQWFSHRVNDVSAFVYRTTASRFDKQRDGGHRGLTHTWPFAVALGAGATFAARNTTGLATVLFLCVSLALRGLLGNMARRTGWIGTTLVSATVTAILVLAIPTGYDTRYLGVLVGVGCIVHCWGDSLTLSGCPWMWPIPIHGQRWYPIGTPNFLRFKAGGVLERRAVLPLWIVAALALAFSYVPGGWATIEWVINGVGSTPQEALRLLR